MQAIQRLTRATAYTRLHSAVRPTFTRIGNSRVIQSAKRHPLILGSFLHSVRYGFFDMFTQFYLLYTGKQEEFNFKRACTFFIFGACFSVYYDYVFYTRFYVYLQKSFGIHPLFLMMIENTFTAPLLWCPTFYWVQEFIETDSPSIASAWETTKKNMVDDVKALYAVWGPFHLISFMFIPPMMRPAFAATVGIIWTVGWSFFRGDIKENQAGEDVEMETALLDKTVEPSSGKPKRNLLVAEEFDHASSNLRSPIEPSLSTDEMKAQIKQVVDGVEGVAVVVSERTEKISKDTVQAVVPPSTKKATQGV